VVPDYKGEALTCARAGDLPAMEQALASSRKRSAAWIEGGEAGAAEGASGAAASSSFKVAAWRPKKRHRVASHSVLHDMDAQLRISSFKKIGLQTFEVDKKTSPFNWQSLSISRPLD
jgi:hypothetical protein